MADLDEELKNALEAAELHKSESAGGDETPAVLTSFEREAPRRNLGLLIGLLALVAGILALVFTSVDEAAIYSVTTDQLVQDKDEYAGRNVRVEGDLKNGTLRYRKEPCEYRFVMQKNGKELAVRYPACVVPDTFKDVPGIDVQVTAEGKLSPEGHFEATHIMAKCPSKYEMQQRAANGEQAPHEMMGEVPGPSADEN
jgi:cytochrome c-type biogenesis protein CcmE